MKYVDQMARCIWRSLCEAVTPRAAVKEQTGVEIRKRNSPYERSWQNKTKQQTNKQTKNSGDGRNREGGERVTARPGSERQISEKMTRLD